MIVYDVQRKPVPLGERAGHGGEATVYHISGQPGRLAKIYEPQPRTGYTGKLEWMVSHPPENPTIQLGHPSLAWPDGLLFDSRRKLAGYRMPYIQQAVPLLEVFNPRRRAVVLPRFDRRYLLRTARNLAAALSALHRSGYVAGDINESNVLVTPAALVTLIDADSFQVREEREGKQIIHPCPVGKPEYTPPELQGKALSEIIRLPDHDSFGLAVLIFQLLMEGSHPFRAQWLASGDPPPLEVRIANGAYPYVESPAYPVIPPKNAPGVGTLHPWLSELFRRCFIDGHLDPRWRPGPDLWVKALAEAEQALVCCAQGHYFSSHLETCPYCSALSKRTAGSRPASPRAGWSPPPFAQRRPSPAAANPAARTSPTRPGVPAAAPARPASVPTRRPAPSGPTIISVLRAINPFLSRLAGYAGQGVAPSVSVTAGGTNVFRSPIPSSGGVLRSRPLVPPGAVQNWLRQRAYKSFSIGGAQGALAGLAPGAAIGLIGWSTGNPLPWPLLMALGGAAGGFLRGWQPGHKMAALIDRYIGWKLFWQAVGLVTGVVAGGLLGLIFIWAVFPVILGLVLGAQAGLYLGKKIWQAGSLVGWERIWGVFSAVGFGALGFGLAKLLGLAGLNAFGENLATGLVPFANNGSVSWALLWMLSGATGSALAGALAGVLSDLIGRLSGLVD